jgi:hypothetical protein
VKTRLAGHHHQIQIGNFTSLPFEGNLAVDAYGNHPLEQNRCHIETLSTV